MSNLAACGQIAQLHNSTDRLFQSTVEIMMTAQTGPNAVSPTASPSTAGMTEISLTFGFDAAHHFLSAPEGHRYGRLHGHSFEVQVTIGGLPDPVMGFVVDFDLLRAATADLRERLDHHVLNEIPGLETPSLERIAIWIFDRLKPGFPGLTIVEVRRPSICESCRYRG